MHDKEKPIVWEVLKRITTITELCKATKRDRNTVRKYVERLVRYGWVIKIENPEFNTNFYVRY